MTPDERLPMTDHLLLEPIDWNGRWKAFQATRRHADDASYWDERSKTFSSADAPSEYVHQFLHLAAIRPGETVLDMGCGTGALSVPLGQQGHSVVAADFSAGMLEVMKGTLVEKDVASVRPVRMSWEDDWSAYGVGEKSVDVCVASRSMAVADLSAALDKLTATARRRVCVTLATGSSPRMDNRVFRVMGLPEDCAKDYLFAFNMLADKGLYPDVAYIRSVRHNLFASRPDAVERYRKMAAEALEKLGEAQRQQALLRLGAWLDEQLIAADDEAIRYAQDHGSLPENHGGELLRLRDPQVTTWAFLSWSAEDR